MKICYVGDKSKNGRIFWNRIGVAFEEDDGSLRVKLLAFPVNGEMVIRQYEPRGATVGAPPEGAGASLPPGYVPVGGEPIDEDDIPF